MTRFRLQTPAPGRRGNVSDFGHCKTYSRNPLFNRKLYPLIGRDPLRILDLACAGGAFVRDCVADGHVAVGLHGAPDPGSKQEAGPQGSMFVCDISMEFNLTVEAESSGYPASFDVITSFELGPEARGEEVAGICLNVRRHLAPGGLWIATLAVGGDGDGQPEPATAFEGREEWTRLFDESGFSEQPYLAEYFGEDWVFGRARGSRGDRFVLTRSEEEPPFPPFSRPYALDDLAKVGAWALHQGSEAGDGVLLTYALELFDRALEDASQIASLHAARACALVALERPDEGHAAASRALLIDPRHADARRIVDQARTASPAVVSPARRSREGPPRISVITPSLNCARYLAECVDSVLGQGYENFEHLVVDGGSNDGTQEILARYGHLRWISEPDRGEADAINKAIRMATGDIIAWLNADDAYLPGVLQLVARELDPDRGRHVVYGKTLIIDDEGETVGVRIPVPDCRLQHALRWFNDLHLYQPSMFYSRELMQDVGLYREDLHFSIDLDYWLRIAARGYEFHFVDRVLAKARLVRADAKSAAPVAEQERSWLEVSASFLGNLSRVEQVDFWKNYTLYRIRKCRERNEPLDQRVEDEPAMLGLALAFQQEELIEPLLLALEKGIERFPESDDLHWLLGETLRAVGSLELARRVFESAASLMKARERT